jgi:hypothetical protein
MKNASLSYHKECPITPLSGAGGATSFAYRCPVLENGRIGSAVPVPHPIKEARKLWCLLRIEVDGVEVRFATPDELDLFITTLRPGRMPSRTTRVFKGSDASRKNRPNQNWFSRLPAKAKSAKWRPVFQAYVKQSKDVQAFRAFYERDPLNWAWEGQNADGLFYHRHQAHRFYLDAKPKNQARAIGKMGGVQSDAPI